MEGPVEKGCGIRKHTGQRFQKAGGHARGCREVREGGNMPVGFSTAQVVLAVQRAAPWGGPAGRQTGAAEGRAEGEEMGRADADPVLRCLGREQNGRGSQQGGAEAEVCAVCPRGGSVCVCRYSTRLPAAEDGPEGGDG